MTIQLTSVPQTRVILPPRIVLYGPEKIGKTTFASEIEGALYFDFEAGSGYANVRRAAEEWKMNVSNVLETIKALGSQEHDYSAVVIDTGDWLEDVIHKQVASEFGKPSISKIEYGKGYDTAVDIWRQILVELNRLTHRGMPVVMLCHNKIKRYDDPLTESYDKQMLKLHDKSAALIKEWCDCLLFANQRVYIDKKDAGFNKKITKGRGGDIVLHTVASPAYEAGNRYGLPAELPFTWADFIAAFNAAVMDPEAVDKTEAA